MHGLAVLASACPAAAAAASPRRCSEGQRKGPARAYSWPYCTSRFRSPPMSTAHLNGASACAQAARRAREWPWSTFHAGAFLWDASPSTTCSLRSRVHAAKETRCAIEAVGRAAAETRPVPHLQCGPSLLRRHERARQRRALAEAHDGVVGPLGGHEALHMRYGLRAALQHGATALILRTRASKQASKHTRLVELPSQWARTASTSARTAAVCSGRS